MDVEQAQEHAIARAPSGVVEHLVQDALKAENVSVVKASTLPERRREAQVMFPELFKESESLEEICAAYADVHDKCDAKDIFSALSQDIFVLACQARLRHWMKVSEKEYIAASTADAEAWATARRIGEMYGLGILKLMYAETSATPARRKEDTGFSILLVRACPIDGKCHSGVINMAAAPNEVARKASLLK